MEVLLKAMEKGFGPNLAVTKMPVFEKRSSTFTQSKHRRLPSKRQALCIGRRRAERRSSTTK